MSLRHMWIVFRKEAKDLVRDRRTLVSSLLIPLIMYPVLFGLMGMGMDKLDRDIQQNITVALASHSNTPEIRDFLQNQVFKGRQNIRLVAITSDPVESIRKGEARFVLEVDSDFAQKIDELKPVGISILYDDSDTMAAGSVGIVAQAIAAFSQSIIVERLSSLGISLEILEPLRINYASIPEDQKSGNNMILMMLPMMMTIMIAVGGIPAATDLVAGEKERSTFEPLLTTRPGRMSLLFGKYLTVTLFSLVSVVAQFAGMTVGMLVNPGYLSMNGSSTGIGGFNIPLGALILVIFITVALGMVFAGLQLAISTYSRSFKEAQTYLSFLIFVAMIPAYATMMLQPTDLQPVMFAVPVLNAIAALKMVLGGAINNTNLLIALGSSAVYVAIALVFSAGLFRRENVLFRS